jgi:hypothetical protein
MPVESSKTPESLSMDPDKVDYRQMCKYGKDCYQKNPMHHQKFRHPDSDEAKASKKRQLEEDIQVINKNCFLIFFKYLNRLRAKIEF